MESNDLCCICLDCTLDCKIFDKDILYVDVDVDVCNSNYIGYPAHRVLNCCGNMIHKHCLMILFIYDYDNCPLCRCNIDINKYFKLDDFEDFYLYSNTSNLNKTLNKTLNKILWKLCNYNYYYYFKTRCKYNINNAFSCYKIICKMYICKVICIIAAVVCFYFLLFYIFTLLYPI